MRKIEDSQSSEALNDNLWNHEMLDQGLPIHFVANEKKTRERNMQKLQTYSKSVAEVPLQTRTERKLRQKESLID